MDTNRIVQQQKLQKIVGNLATCLAEMKELPDPSGYEDHERLLQATQHVVEAMSRLRGLLYDEADR